MKPTLRSSCALGGAFVLSLLAACGDAGDRGRALFGPSPQPATHTDAGRGGQAVGGAGSASGSASGGVSASTGGSSAGTNAAGSAALGGAGTSSAPEGGADSSSGGAEAGAASEPVVALLPSGFEATDIGGYRRGAALAGNELPPNAGGSGSGAGCGNILSGIVRDFKRADTPGGHPDFNADFGGNDVTLGLVSAALGSDRKPVYASACELGAAVSETCPFGAQTTSLANFNQWYRSSSEVNSAFAISFFLAPLEGGIFSFQSLNYFPLDGVEFDVPTPGDDGKSHNFGFTTELHARFVYRGGETFRFEGDDDVWVFMNGKLALDLGGLHPMQQRAVSLDTDSERLGLVKGGTYALDLFHAERHTGQSTFRLDTDLLFVDCGGGK